MPQKNFKEKNVKINYLNAKFNSREHAIISELKVNVMLQKTQLFEN